MNLLLLTFNSTIHDDNNYIIIIILYKRGLTCCSLYKDNLSMVTIIIRDNTVFLLKIRHENNIALASPNF